MFSATARNQLAWAIAGNDPAKNKTPFPLSSDDPNDHIAHTSSGRDHFEGFIQPMKNFYNLKKMVRKTLQQALPTQALNAFTKTMI